METRLQIQDGGAHGIRKKSLSLMFLVLFLATTTSSGNKGPHITSSSDKLLLIGGIEPNPGPRKPKFPCIVCTKACTLNCIACDDCDNWMHKTCIGLSSAEFSALGKSEDRWVCSKCHKPNNSSILYHVPDEENEEPNLSTQPSFLDSISDISRSTRGSTSSNQSSDLSFHISSPSFHPHTSSPIATRDLNTKKRKTNRSLRILNINFQSLRKKNKLLESIIDDSNPDIIIGTETWLDPNIRSSEILPTALGYTILRRDRPNDPHGGVLIAIKSYLEPRGGISSDTIEFLTAEIRTEKKTVCIAAFYRPPNMNDETYLNSAKQEFSRLKTNNKNTIIIVAGDFNLPDINWQTLSITSNQYPSRVNKAFLDIIADNNLEQIVDFPTRQQNTLDLILTSHPTYKVRCKPIPSIGSSDHDIVLLDTNIRPKRPKPVRRTIHLWKKADIDGIKKDLSGLEERMDLTSSNINTVWLQLKDTILNVMNHRVPSKQPSSRYTNPWMNTDIKRTIRRKQRAFKKAKQTNQKRDRDRYKRLQKEVQFKIRRANKKYLQETVSGDFRDNSKRFWSYVKSKGQETTGVAPLKNSNGFLQSEATARANILNDQFKSVFTDEDLSDMPDLGSSSVPPMPGIKVDWKGVHKLLINLRPHKATGPDSIPAFILKAAATELAPALAKMFQMSLDLGQVPDDWREAAVVPIFKKGDRHQASNYRPVSLTSVTCKLLEHIIHSSIMSHFDKHNILTDSQHGFRKRRSCETQLITTIHQIANNLAENQQVDIILLDFAKAFDKVPHSRLLLKMRHYGVRDSTLEWIKSFLTKRNQQVTLDGAQSDKAEVKSGVPQGSVLGPLLFLAYNNDLPDTAKSSTTKLFADDSMMMKVIRNGTDSRLLQEDLSALESWEKSWQMRFNPSKCVVIRIAHKRTKILETQYQLHGHTLEVVDASKYLGVTITDDLGWDSHIRNVINKGNRTVGFLRRNLRDCTKPVREAAYRTIARPTLEYAATVWDPTQQTSIKALEQVQRRAARFVLNDYTSRTPGCVTKMIEDLKWDTLETRRQHARLQLLFKIHHGLVDIPANQYLRTGDTRTRGENRFFQERHSDRTFLSTFFPRTVREWNSRPDKVTSAGSLEEFQRLLRA